VTLPTQPQLFFVEGDTTTGSVELFPAVWNAAQNLASPTNRSRFDALDELVKMNAVRLSPLVAYLVATRLIDPEVHLRDKIIEVLADVLSPDNLGRPAPDEVRSYLVSYFSQISEPMVTAILEASINNSHLRTRISRLFNLCPSAGKHLAAILADRQAPIEIRKHAADFIGLVGFVDALPTLERLRNRIEARQGGQRSMSFAPPAGSDESVLLPAITTALTLLQSE
jgi:hypothetical protein